MLADVDGLSMAIQNRSLLATESCTLSSTSSERFPTASGQPERHTRAERSTARAAATRSPLARILGPEQVLVVPHPEVLPPMLTMWPGCSKRSIRACPYPDASAPSPPG